MDTTVYVAALEINPAAITALARAMPADQARWRPMPTDWSALEAINHLVDEEREDFRARLDFVLHWRGETPPRNDPDNWVVDRAYNQRDLDESLAHFQRERQRSLSWLRGFAALDWSHVWEGPSGYTLRADDVLAAWAAHDVLHLRQLVELRYQYLAAQAAPYRADYAGDW